MKATKRACLAAGILAACALLQGCAAVVAGGALAGGTYGTISYASNTLEATQKASLDDTWAAGISALKELAMPLDSMKKNKTSGKLKAQTAQKQPVTIHLSSKGERATEIQITVGTFDTQANRALEQKIYDKMRVRL